jgi:hypothetical protein
MTTTFLNDPGTSGFIATPFNLLSTELSALASGAACVSSVGGASGVFNQMNFASAIWGKIYLTAGGAFTPAIGGTLSGWWLESPDGGTTFETEVATPSTTVAALSRSPDFIISLDNAAYATGNIRFASSFVKLPWASCKVLLQNNSGVALPATGNLIKVGPVAIQSV